MVILNNYILCENVQIYKYLLINYGKKKQEENGEAKEDNPFFCKWEPGASTVSCGLQSVLTLKIVI